MESLLHVECVRARKGPSDAHVRKGRLAVKVRRRKAEDDRPIDGAHQPRTRHHRWQLIGDNRGSRGKRVERHTASLLHRDRLVHEKTNDIRQLGWGEEIWQPGNAITLQRYYDVLQIGLPPGRQRSMLDSHSGCKDTSNTPSDGRMGNAALGIVGGCMTGNETWTVTLFSVSTLPPAV